MKIIEFITATIILTLMPGPDIIFVLTQSIIKGAKAGITIAAGLCGGLIVHTCLIACGMGAIVAQNNTLLYIIKIAGACYLIYLAITSIMEVRKKRGETKIKETNHDGLFKKGLIMNLLNPKIIVFFLAFFPPFLVTAQDLATDTIILGVTFTAVAFTIFSAVSLLSGYISKKAFVLNENSMTIAIIKATTYTAIASFIFFN